MTKPTKHQQTDKQKTVARLVRKARSSWHQFIKTRKDHFYASAISFMVAARIASDPDIMIASSNLPLSVGRSR
jgi:hypothetical protein